MKTILAAAVGSLFFGQIAHAQLSFLDKSIQKAASPDDQTIAAEYRIQNSGTYPVNVVKLIPECSCTKAALDKTLIAPGESAVMKVTLDLKNRRGKVFKTVAVSTDDPAHSDATVALIVNVPEVIHMEPFLVKWNAGDEPKSHEVKLTAVSKFPFHVLKVTSNNPQFFCRVKIVKDGSDYSVLVEPVDTKQARNAVLKIQTDINSPKWSTLVVYAQVKGGS